MIGSWHPCSLRVRQGRVPACPSRIHAFTLLRIHRAFVSVLSASLWCTLYFESASPASSAVRAVCRSNGCSEWTPRQSSIRGSTTPAGYKRGGVGAGQPAADAEAQPSGGPEPGSARFVKDRGAQGYWRPRSGKRIAVSSRDGIRPPDAVQWPRCSIINHQ
jgi:hypothetical protein